MKSAQQLAAVFATRGGAALGGVLLSLLVARLSGPEGLGQFALFLSILGAGAILARRGLDMLLIRAVAKAELNNARTLSFLLLRHGLGVTLSTALVLAVPSALLLQMGYLGSSVPNGALAIVICLPMLTVLALISAYLKGSGKPWLAPIFEIGGVSLLASVLIVIAGRAGIIIGGVGVLLLFSIAIALLCGVAFFQVHRNAPAEALAWDPPPLTAEHRIELSRGQTEFTLIALSTFLVQAGSFALVAPFLTEESLGLVRAAERLALIISFPVLAINPFIAARVVRHVQAGHRAALWRLIVKAMIAGGSIVAPILALIIIAPQIPLQLMGAEFVSATPYLRVMALTHFVLVLLGPFVMVMSMSGGEREAMWIALTTLVAACTIYPTAAAIWGSAGFVGAYAGLTTLRSIAIAICSYGRTKKLIGPDQ